MNIVIFDLETTMAFKKEHLQHIVEIGACKIPLTGTPEIIDTFQLYVQPKIKIGKSTKKFIKATNKDFENALSTTDAINEFSDWLGNDYYLCSWSDSDLFILLQQSGIYGFSLNWLKNYNDIQPQISYAIEGNLSQIGLKKALNVASIPLIGNSHSAYDDAINTGQLFIKYKDTIKLAENEPSENYSMSSSLYRRCLLCGEVKYYKELLHIKRKPQKKCKACYDKAKKEHNETI